MPMLHDARVRSKLVRRLGALRPDARRRWGRMEPAQMLWHVATWLEVALGKRTVARERSLLPRPLLRLLVIHLPWPKGAPTPPAFVARGEHDFEAERQRCLELIAAFAAKGLEDAWAPSPLLGPLSGRDASRLQAKHLDHHLRQFGV